MSGYTPAPGNPLTGVKTDSSGNVTGMVASDGSVIPLSPPPNCVASGAVDTNGHLLLKTFGGDKIDAGAQNLRGSSSYTTADAGSGTVTRATGGFQFLWLTGNSSAANLTVILPSDAQDKDRAIISSAVTVQSLIVKDSKGNLICSSVPLPSASEIRFLNIAGTWALTQKPSALTSNTPLNMGIGSAALAFGTLLAGATGTVTVNDAKVHAGNLIFVNLASGQADLGNGNPIRAVCQNDGVITFSIKATVALTLGTVNVTYAFTGN